MALWRVSRKRGSCGALSVLHVICHSNTQGIKRSEEKECPLVSIQLAAKRRSVAVALQSRVDGSRFSLLSQAHPCGGR